MTNVNEPPSINGLSSSLNTDENTTNVVQVSATDPEGDAIYYSVSGTDSSLFNINSSGLVTFKNAPDYETPLDSGGDNIYGININVSDENSSVASTSSASNINTESSSNSVNVTVNNIDEDLIDLVLTTTDGTASAAPTLNIALKIDELTKASEVQALTWLIDNTQTWYTALKVDALNWSIAETLATTATSGTYEIRKILIKRNNLDDLTIVDTALKEKGFDIDSVIYNTRSDSTDPILTGVDSITVSGNDDDSSTNIVVTIVASVNDGLGEIDKVFSYIKGPGEEIDGEWGILNSDKSKVTFNFTLDPRAASGLSLIHI